MDGDDFDIPADCYLMLMIEEELSVHCVDVLKDRIKILRQEISRTEEAISLKSVGKIEAEQLFK